MKFLFFMFVFLIIAEGSLADNGSIVSGKPDNTFIDLFVEWRAHGNGKATLTDEATEYVLKYYPTKDAALEMLKKNGFKVTVKEFPPEYYANYGFGNKKEHFDVILFGHRGMSVQRFWLFWKNYQAYVYTNNNKVVVVSARVESTLP